jgi:hypothetical protein
MRWDSSEAEAAEWSWADSSSDLTAEDGSARSVVEVVAENMGASLRWATATTTRATRGPSH